jgi:invasion protein IalB
MSMTNLPCRLALSFGLILALGALPALAQETAPAAPVVGDAATADGLNMGTDPNAAPAAMPTKETAEVNQTYVLANFDSWEQRCVKAADGSDPCQMYQLLKDKDGNNVAEISMFPLPKGGKAAAGATIIAPLETLLTANLQLSIDGSKAKIYPFTFCAQIGCVARVGFTGEEVTQFQKGNAAVITIVPAAAPDQKVELKVSLDSFSKAYEAVQATMPK